MMGECHRPDGRTETDDDQHATGWSNDQPDRHTDEHTDELFIGYGRGSYRLAVVPGGLDHIQPHSRNTGC